MSNKPGLNLSDLAPMYEDVPFEESFLRVFGISAKDGLEIFRRYPKIAGMVSGDKFNLGAFLTAAPDVVAAIIAAACGELGDEKAEENASRIPVEQQFEILEAIGRLTFSKGFGPFVEKIMALVNRAGSGHSGKASDMKSPPVSKASSQPDTTQT